MCKCLLDTDTEGQGVLVFSKRWRKLNSKVFMGLDG